MTYNTYAANIINLTHNTTRTYLNFEFVVYDFNRIQSRSLLLQIKSSVKGKGGGVDDVNFFNVPTYLKI